MLFCAVCVCYTCLAAYFLNMSYHYLSLSLLHTYDHNHRAYGPVTCVVYPLKPLEEALTVMMDRHRLDLLTTSTRMRDLINRKWETFAMRLFNWRLVRFIVVLAAFQTAVFIGPTCLYTSQCSDVSDGVNGGECSNEGDQIDALAVLQLLCELFVFVAASLKFYTECAELVEYGLTAHFLRWL